MTDYRATYSPDDNKLRLYGVPKELYPRVRAAGFIWAPRQRICIAPAWSPKAEDIAIELAGEIGDEDTSLTERAELRAERFEEYSDKRGAEADRAHEAVTSNPAYVAGQPIHVGHHSQRRAERDKERIEKGLKKAVSLWETSKYWTSRAAGAIRHAKYKQDPGVRARRIKELEADQRKEQRSRKEFAALLELYTDPKTADLTARDGRNMRRAVLASYDGGLSYTDSSAFEKGTLSYDDAIAKAITHCNAVVAQCDRWINHLDNRLTYEKVMLDDQDASELIAPKPRRKLLPLCNYRAPKGITLPNRYSWGTMETYKQVDMTSAEYAKIRTEYKGTRIVDRSHRARVAVLSRDHVCVFLTDSKVHKRPAPAAEVQAPLPEPKLSTYVYREPERNKFDDLKETLRHGVKAISAPQLFVTSPDLADNILDDADIKAHHRILEPSAGTGNLLRAILRRQPSATCIAVEVIEQLADTLQAQFPDVGVVRANFLKCNGDLGTFDWIIMNPPFKNGQDVKHVQHAVHMLKAGGRLKAIMSAGVTFRKEAADFRAMIEERGGCIEPLPDGSFEDSGTDVRTVLVTLSV